MARGKSRAGGIAVDMNGIEHAIDPSNGLRARNERRMHAGIDAARLAVQEGDHAEAIVVGRALEPNLEAWLAARPDTDVEDDLAILRALLANVERDAPADTDVSQSQPTPRWSYD